MGERKKKGPDPLKKLTSTGIFKIVCMLSIERAYLLTSGVAALYKAKTILTLFTHLT